jgi:hypothetical protein
MNTKDTILTILVVAVVTFFAGMLLSYLSCQPKPIVITKTETKIDTVIKVLPSEPIVITKMKAKIVYVRDTIIETKPFVAQIDTIIKYDTIQAKYEFPENYFSLLVRPKPDSIRTVTITVKEGYEIEPPWYETPLTFFAGVGAGVLLKSVLK